MSRWFEGGGGGNVFLAFYVFPIFLEKILGIKKYKFFFFVEIFKSSPSLTG